MSGKIIIPHYIQIQPMLRLNTVILLEPSNSTPYSNTTNVKVKRYITATTIKINKIQIQPMLRLNFSLPRISTKETFNSNTTNVKVKLVQIGFIKPLTQNSNTTNVKVKRAPRSSLIMA